MQIIQFNHKTAANLLKKSVEEYWLDENKDAWFRFTDGSTVCVHLLEDSWDAYMAVEKFDGMDSVAFSDDQSIMGHWYTDGKEHLYTSRSTYIIFDKAKYFYHRNFNYVTRQYIPVIEFHYYEKGEDIARND